MIIKGFGGIKAKIRASRKLKIKNVKVKSKCDFSIAWWD